MEAVAIAIIKSEFKIGDSLLEIGCGNGRLTCLLALIYPNVQIVAMDQCENAISIAKQRASSLGIKNIEFIADAAIHAIFKQRNKAEGL